MEGGPLLSARVSKVSFRLSGLPLCAAGIGGLGGSGLRFLADRGFPEVDGDRKGDDSGGVELGSRFSLGIRGGRCFWEDGVRVSQSGTLAPLAFASVFIEIGEETRRRRGRRERRWGKEKSAEAEEI